MKKNKKNKTIIIIISIFLVILFSSIVYSAFSSTMTITGNAHARVETNVRITDFRLASSNNATSSYEDFGKNHISTNVDLKTSSSTLTYYLEITNYGTTDIGIFDITGLPTGVNYSIKDYNLHDKICNEEGKCNSFIKRTYELTLTTTSSYSGNIQLNFDFRTYHKITYTDITNNNYPTEVIDGGTLKITFKEELKRVQVLYNNSEILYYKTITNGQTITLGNITKDVELKTKEPVVNLVTGDLNTIGSEVCIGSECFYIISNDGSTVAMLSKLNITLDNVPIQSSSAATLAFSSTAYWSSTTSTYPSYVYNENSNLYEYVENYKSYLEGFDVEINNSRLITMSELESLGCSRSNYNCTKDNNWVYSTSYWSGEAYSSSNLWRIYNGNALHYNSYTNDYYGIRPVIELSVDEIRPLVRVKTGNYDTIGSEVCIDDECFYVISNNENSVKMLSKYNLHVGNKFDDKNGMVALTNPTGIQNEKAIGWFSGYSPENPMIGTKPFSSTNYWSSTTNYPAFVYNENSYLYEYVENYKNYLTNKGTVVKDASIISYEELINLGCNNTSCSNAPSWVYSTTYWVGTASSKENIWRVSSDGSFENAGYTYDSRGVRPTITIPKCYFNKTIAFTVDNVSYLAKEGMTWGEWIYSRYNRDGFVEDGEVVYNSSNNNLASCNSPNDIIVSNNSYTTIRYSCS